jgi:hypothetical protein
MKTVIRRLNRLEDRFGPKKPREVLRIVVTQVGAGDADLEKATCTRSLCSDGTLMELIDLNSCNNPFTSDELDRFVERFPVDPWPHAGSR